MSWTLDGRIPVLLVPDAAGLAAALAAGPKAAVLLGGGGGPAGAAPDAGAAVTVAVERYLPEPAPHTAACACCQGRSQAAAALDRLFQARVRGRVAWFDRVLALAPDPAAEAELRAALGLDPLTRARFRQG